MLGSYDSTLFPGDFSLESVDQQKIFSVQDLATKNNIYSYSLSADPNSTKRCKAEEACKIVCKTMKEVLEAIKSKKKFELAPTAIELNLSCMSKYFVRGGVVEDVVAST